MLTFAMRSSEEDQITFLSSASFGSTVAFSTVFFPAATLISGLSSVISVTLWVTLMLILARMLLPSFAIATMRAVPRFTPVTFPFSSTVASFSSTLLQVTSRMEASAGSIAALREIVSPTATVFTGAVTLMRLTGFTTSTRYRTWASGSATLDTVTMVSPAFSPVIRFPPTRITVSSSAVRIAFLFFTLFGITVAFRSRLFLTGSTSTGSPSASPPAFSSPAIAGSAASCSGSFAVLTSSVTLSPSAIPGRLRQSTARISIRETSTFFMFLQPPCVRSSV